MRKFNKVLSTLIAVSATVAMVVCAGAAEPRSSSIPTSEWVLDNNNYHFSAYINGYKLYSNYYFYVSTANRFHFFGNEYDGYSSGAYNVGVVNKSNGNRITKYVPQSATGFNMFHTDYSMQMGNYFYFFIDGSPYGTEVSLDGYMNTY